MRRDGFTLMEAMLVVTILGLVTATVVPAWRDWQVRNDLLNATEQVSQGLDRARTRAQAGEAGTAWGMQTVQGVVFSGKTFATRNQSRDEHYLLTPAVAVTGLTEVTFALHTGEPTATGTVVLTSLRGERRIVNIAVDRHGITTTLGDTLTICHCQSNPPHTLHIPDSAWPAHQKHGDLNGACRTPETRCK